MPARRSPTGLALLVALALALTACGGESDPPATDPPPAEQTGGQPAEEPSTPPAGMVGLDIDVDPCSALTETDLTELGLETLGQTAVEGQGAFTGIWPQCMWQSPDGANEESVTLTVQDAGQNDGFESREDPVAIGDGGYQNEHDLVFADGGYVYVLSGFDSEQAPQAQALREDIARRILANGGAGGGYLDGIPTAEFVGGPAVGICDLIDAEAYALSLDLAGDSFMIWPGYQADDLRYPSYDETRMTCNLGDTSIRLEIGKDFDDICDASPALDPIDDREACAVGSYTIAVKLNDDLYLSLSGDGDNQDLVATMLTEALGTWGAS